MAENTKDIALRIGVTTSGSGQVNSLAKDLDALAKEGGAAAPEFARLAAELRKIGEQDAVVQQVKQLQEAVDQTAQSFNGARAKADQFGASLSEQQAKTEALREQQAAARSALEQTAKQVRDTRAELDLLKASTDEEGRKTAEYKAQVIALGTKLAELQAVQREQRVEQQAATRELNQSEAQLRQATKAVDGATAASAKLGEQLQAETNALSQAKAAMSAAGVAAGDLAGAQTEVAQSLDRTRAVILTEIESYQRLESIQEAVAASNERNVALARAAAQARVEAARQATEAEREQQRAAEAAALAAQLAAQQEEAAARQAARVAQEAQQQINQAFGTIGVRSAQQVTEELGRVREAMETIRNTAGLSGAGLAQAMEQGEARVRQLERELRAANGQLTLMDRAAGAISSTIGQFTAGALFANIIQNAAYQVGQLGVEAVKANSDLQKLELGLKSVYGTTEAATKQIEFLRGAAQQAGVSVSEIGGAYVKFAASAKDANIPVETTNGLFMALTKNAATLGLSGDKVADMLNALGQMAGKGVVQMEELRGQLGDALPGALPKVAKGLGITVLEMEKLARNGELLASEVFPALQKVLEQSGGEVDTMSARWARFKNVMTETAQDIGEGVIGKAISAVAGGAGRVLEHLAFTATLVSESFTVLGKDIGIAAADIEKQGLKFRGFSDEAKKAFAEVKQESDDKLERLAGRIAGVGPVAEQAFGKVGEAAAHAGDKMVVVGDKITYVGDQAKAAAPGVQANANAHEAGATSAGKNASAQAQAGSATAAAGQSAAGASTSWTQLTVAYGKVNEVLDQQVKIAKVSLDAKKAEGSAAQELAQISGNEAQARNASAAAARNNRDAQSALTQALENQLGVLRAQRDAEIALYNASTTKSEAQRKAIEDLSKDIQLKAQEVEKNKEVTESLRNETLARETASATMRDNSARLYELRAAYVTSTQALKDLSAKQDKSAEGSKRLADADREAARAAALYRDALNDQIDKIEQSARAKQAKFSVEEASIRLAIEEARTAEEVAKARGDYTAATEASNRVKQLEIELLRLQAQAQKAEAEAILAALPAKRAQLELEGKLTEAMKKSLEAEELSARAKLKQSEITEELANRIARVKSATDEAAASAGNSTGGFDAMAGSMDKAASSADRLSGSMRRASSTTYGAGEAPVIGADGKPVPGFVQKTVMSMDQDAISVLRQKRDLGLLSTGDKATAEAAYMAETANAATLSGINQAMVSPGVAQQAASRASDAKQILDSIRAMERAGSQTTAPAAPAGISTGSVHNVNVMLGGQSTTIGTASFADAQALTNMLQQLGSASQRTTG